MTPIARRGFWRAGVALAALLASTPGRAETFPRACSDPATGCSDALSAECLRLGAGSIAATPAGQDCESQMQRYSACLAYVAESCPQTQNSVSARETQAPPGHRVVAESAFDGWRQLYVLAGGPLGWAEAAKGAEAMGGRLVVIDSAEKNDAVYGVLVKHPELFRPAPVLFVGNLSLGPFIGLYQKSGAAEPGGGWRWVDGSPVSYTNWLQNQPDNWFFAEHVGNIMCLNRATCDSWNDIKPEAEAVASYIVEIPAR